MSFVFKILFSLLGFAVLQMSLAEESLRRSDIQKIMEQIFSQHVNKKAISSDIIKNSFKVYIEQFDPDGIYLLQSEVDPYFNMDNENAALIERQYKKGDYNAYEKLNALIQNSISRARYYRSELQDNPYTIFAQARSIPARRGIKGNVRYPFNQDELRIAIQKNMAEFIQDELRRFGEKGVRGYESRLLALYEKHMKNWESPYLYQMANGEAMDEEEQENFFVLHVLKSIAKSLDAHTAFFTPSEAYDLRVRLEKGFEGIGIIFQETPRGIVVMHLMEGSPAAKNGEIKAGDYLIEINGHSVEGVSFGDVLDFMKEDKEKPIFLVFKRPTKGGPELLISVVLKREALMMDDRIDVNYEQFGNGIIGRITLHSFYANDQGVTSERDVREAIEKLNKDASLKGLILDLRENSGGFLSQAVKVAGLFITNGVVVISKYSNGDEKIYRDMDNRVVYKGPLIVLTSKATASAAEIVAQALQDYGVALVVGDEQTYGKGTIQSQTVTERKGSSFFKVTVGKYYTVSGKTPQLFGVAADIVVPGPFSKAQLGEEFLELPIAQRETIAPTYTDALKDIDPDIRPWYAHYYVPTLQEKDSEWQVMLPELKKNSTYRLEHNKNYQLFLKQLSPSPAGNALAEDEIRKSGNFGAGDLQLSEATNILKDMIYLQAQARQKEYMIGSDQVDKNR